MKATGINRNRCYSYGKLGSTQKAFDNFKIAASQPGYHKLQSRKQRLAGPLFTGAPIIEKEKQMAQLTTKIGGLTLKNPVILGAGPLSGTAATCT